VIAKRGVRNQAQQGLLLTETNHEFNLTLIIDFLFHPDSIRVNGEQDESVIENKPRYSDGSGMKFENHDL
jgi:hypothetical protein